MMSTVLNLCFGVKSRKFILYCEYSVVNHRSTIATLSKAFIKGRISHPILVRTRSNLPTDLPVTSTVSQIFTCHF